MNELLEYKGYQGTVHFDVDAGILHGEVLHLNDVITFQGRTVEEIIQAFRDSVDDYLEFCAQRDEKPEKPYSGKFMLRISPALHRKLAGEAARRGTSINAFVAKKLERVS